MFTCGCWLLGDGCLGVAAPVVSALLTVATAAELLLLAVEASPLIQVERLVKICDCDPFAITATFGVMPLCSSSSLFTAAFISIIIFPSCCQCPFCCCCSTSFVDLYTWCHIVD